MDTSLTPEALTSLLASDDKFSLLDVRRKEDFDANPCRIAHGQWQNPAEIDQWLPNLPADQEVVVYCARGGSVSQSVQQHLAEKGLKTRYVSGGLEAIIKQNEKL